MVTTLDTTTLFLIIAAAVAVGSFVGLTAFAFIFGATLRRWLA